MNITPYMQNNLILVFIILCIQLTNPLHEYKTTYTRYVLKDFKLSIPIHQSKQKREELLFPFKSPQNK